mmetsp:Transcript_8111/g.36475  ORF Transcript_8111/g.36475 Transcript_8111/m.36475 type:complete len:257 (-) Transcript_8111:4473-5243(-)
MIMHGSLPLGHRRRPNLILGIRPVLRAMVQPVLIQMARSEKVPAPVATTALAPVSLDWTMILDRPPHATAPATQQTLPTRATRGLTHLDVASCWITTRLFPKRRVAAVELDAASCLKNAAIHMVIHVVDGVTLNLIPIVSRSFVVSRRTAGTAAAAATAGTRLDRGDPAHQKNLRCWAGDPFPTSSTRAPPRRCSSVRRARPAQPARRSSCYSRTSTRWRISTGTRFGSRTRRPTRLSIRTTRPTRVWTGQTTWTS